MTPTPPFQTPLLCPSVIVKAYAPRVNKFSPLFRGGERESVYAISTSPSGRFDARFMEIKKLRVARGRSRLPIQPGNPPVELCCPRKSFQTLSSRKDCCRERKMFGEEDPRDWKISMAFELSKSLPRSREQYLDSKVLI